jgi:hypothetical protein
MSDGSAPPKLDPTTLYDEQEKRDALRLKTYNNILEQVHNKIRVIARMPTNEKSLLFTVPEFVLGVPRFNTRDCILYLVWNLRQTKFDVQYIPPTLLFISWQRHDTQYKEERSPIVQTLKNAISPPPSTESQPKSVIKKTTHQYLPSQAPDSNAKKVTFI